GILDQAFGEREAQRELLEVAGRGHHHRECAAVVAQRHRHFLDDAVGDPRRACRAAPLRDLARGDAALRGKRRAWRVGGHARIIGGLDRSVAEPAMADGKPPYKPYDRPAGGWGSAAATAKVLLE